MKRILCLLTLLPSAAFAIDGEAWIHEPPVALTSASALPAKAVHEVVASKQDAAVLALENASWVKVAEREGKYWAGTEVECRKGAHLYLVRAVFGHRRTGAYFVRQSGTALLVSHGSLGHSTPKPTRSALLLCLAAAPKDVFVQMSVAE